MPAQSFEDVMFKLTCTRLAQDVLQYYAKADTPVHPTWPAVNAVLAGVGMVYIARNGYITIVEQP